MSEPGFEIAEEIAENVENAVQDIEDEPSDNSELENEIITLGVAEALCPPIDCQSR